MNVPEESGFKPCGCPAVTSCIHGSGADQRELSALRAEVAAKDARIAELQKEVVYLRDELAAAEKENL